MIEERTFLTLEYDKILNLISAECILEKSKQKALELKPVTDIKKVQYSLDVLEETFLVKNEYLVSFMEYFDEPSLAIKKASIENTLSIKELLIIARLLRSSRIAKTSVLEIESDKINLFKNIVSELDFDLNLENEILSSVKNESELNDTASNELYSIRRKIRSTNSEIKAKLDGFTKGAGVSKYLQENIVTLRNDRYVIPVKQEHRSKVAGLLHDISTSRQTVYIEPIEIVELNNNLRALEAEEAEEIERILIGFTRSISKIADILKKNTEILVNLDILNAKSVFCGKIRATKQTINSNGVVDIIDGRHPLIDAKSVRKVSVSVGEKYEILIITGSNTGGKTVTLKMVGLFTLMSMAGLFLPCESGSNIAVFKNVFCDIGDEQSIENSLSTFSSHIKNICEITENADSNSLVLLDEVGAGTDPEEGSALAESIVNYLLNQGAKGILTTHYRALKEYPFRDKRTMNAKMEFDYNTLKPTYKLILGDAGSSNALSVAEGLGLNKQIIEYAKKSLSKEKQQFDNIIREAEHNRQEYLNKKNEIEAVLFAQKEALKQIEKDKELISQEKEKSTYTAKIKAKQIVNEARNEAEELLKEIKQKLDSDNLSYKDYIEASSVKNKIDTNFDFEEEISEKQETLEIKDYTTLKEGQSVFVTTISSTAVVKKLNFKKKECIVLSGNMEIAVPFKTLKMLKNSKKVTQKQEKIKVNKAFSNNLFSSEIKLLGFNLDEALIELDTFISSAIIQGVEEIKIIHGKGQGILRKGIQNFLKTHPHIAEYRDGKYGEGETGVTFAKIK